MIDVALLPDSFLLQRGWSQDVYDLCWLDCPSPGYRKTWHHSEICLCSAHAVLLENGYLNATYAGAPLPTGSRATAWPWRRQESRVVEVV